MRLTAKEAIDLIQTTYANALDEPLVITWWDRKDFEGLDLDQALSVCDDALDVCISHVNETVGDFAPADEVECDCDGECECEDQE